MAVFLVFIAEYPFARFFFGVPAWAIGAVIVGIQVLQYLGYDESERILLLFVTIATAAPDGPQHGPRREPPVDPQDPVPGDRGGRRSASGGRRGQRRWRRRSSPGRGAASSGGGPARGAPLPQPPGPAAPMDQAELDALLDKISGLGMDGLSSDEKRRLNDLSKRMRKR